MVLVLEIIITVKKSYYAMAIEGKRVENYNKNGDLPII